MAVELTPISKIPGFSQWAAAQLVTTDSHMHMCRAERQSSKCSSARGLAKHIADLHDILLYPIYFIYDTSYVYIYRERDTYVYMHADIHTCICI